MKDKHSLKNILSLLMSECDIDDASLAKQTGIPASTISRLRNSDCNPTAHTLRPIAKFFDVTIDQLLGVNHFLLIDYQEHIYLSLILQLISLS